MILKYDLGIFFSMNFKSFLLLYNFDSFESIILLKYISSSLTILQSLKVCNESLYYNNYPYF